MVVPFTLLSYFLILVDDRPKMESCIGTSDLTKVTLASGSTKTTICPRFSFKEYVQSQLDVDTICTPNGRNIVDYYKAYNYLIEKRSCYLDSAKKVFAYFLIDISTMVLNTFPSIIDIKEGCNSYFSCKKYCMYDYKSYFKIIEGDEDFDYMEIKFENSLSLINELNRLVNGEDIEPSYDYLKLLSGLNIESYHALSTNREEIGEALIMKYTGFKLLERLDS